MKILLTLTFLTITCSSTKAQNKSFDFRYDDNGIDIINTSDRTFTRKYIHGDTLIRFELTAEDRKIILSYADKLGIRKIKSPIGRKDCGVISFPALMYEMEFFDDKDELIKLNWGNNLCGDKTIEKLQTFLDKVVHLIMSKKELKGLKESDVMLL